MAAETFPCNCCLKNDHQKNTRTSCSRTLHCSRLTLSFKGWSISAACWLSPWIDWNWLQVAAGLHSFFETVLKLNGMAKSCPQSLVPRGGSWRCIILCQSKSKTKHLEHLSSFGVNLQSFSLRTSLNGKGDPVTKTQGDFHLDTEFSILGTNAKTSFYYAI